MRLLLDAQLPPGLARRLTEVGHEAFDLFDLLPPDASDMAVAERANELRAVLVSKDEDFLNLVARDILTMPFIWLRSGNMTTARLWENLEPLLPRIQEALAAGERVIEIR